ncbi:MULTISPECIES: GIY-YIG nuclease family protein [unclassified Micromonospora]|uniref:GIY-YIG nuclease family protein n=1 Tax=unclassified Micromonospora TaxID=2617518 RepID=UPI001C23AF99|nr:MULTISPECIES: GIY-YIG nuclease family protein [unclassified Micromonospora]MBU8857409.1 GIY-YIG nuclease family protein [Micromonospora sp. WMMB482]MDM4783033.1 GIY-YIG nuclease family protein [Micromonospora sp. b486]
MTLCTVIRDVYGPDERRTMGAALRELLPAVGFDWHPSGVYCFWDPQSRDVLYVGLAKDIPKRFAQHNGLSGSSTKGNKRAEIDQWFTTHSAIGYSILVQSGAVAMIESPSLDTPSEIIALGEGQLIEAHRQRYGARPPWNAIGGSTGGARWAGAFSSGWFALLTGRQDCLLVARRTIRQLAGDPLSIGREMTLHAARLNAAHLSGLGGQPFGDKEIVLALEQLVTNPPGGASFVYDDFTASGYLHLDAPHPERE